MKRIAGLGGSQREAWLPFSFSLEIFSQGFQRWHRGKKRPSALGCHRESPSSGAKAQAVAAGGKSFEKWAEQGGNGDLPTFNSDAVVRCAMILWERAMSRKNVKTLPLEMVEAIAIKDLAALKSAAAACEAEQQGGFSGGLSKLVRGRDWCKQLSGQKTALGLAIEERWAEGVKWLARLTSHTATVDYLRDLTAAGLCIETRWVQGLVEVAKAGERQYRTDALRMACAAAAPECVIALLANGASARQHEEERRNPLFSAVSGGSLECVKILTDHGARPWIQTYSVEGGMRRREGSPIFAGLDRKTPQWEIINFFLSLDEREKWMGKPSLPLNKSNRTPFMVVMNDPALIESALSFNKGGIAGEDILWKMSEGSDIDQRDINGLTWINYANATAKDESNASRAFKLRVLERFVFSKQEPARRAIEKSVDGSVELAQEMWAEEQRSLADPENAQEKGGATEKSRQRQGEPREAGEVDAAIEQCLAGMMAMAQAMASISSAVESLAALSQDSSAREKVAKMESEALGILERAAKVRGQLAEISDNSSQGGRRARLRDCQEAR